MAPSYHSKIRSTQNKGVTFLFSLRHISILSVLFLVLCLLLLPHADAQPETFQGMRGFVEIEHFDKHFVKNA